MFGTGLNEGSIRLFSISIHFLSILCNLAAVKGKSDCTFIQINDAKAKKMAEKKMKWVKTWLKKMNIKLVKQCLKKGKDVHVSLSIMNACPDIWCRAPKLSWLHTGLENRRLVVWSPARPIFFTQVDDRYCNRNHSSLAFHSCNNGYLGKQPVAWKKYSVEYWSKDLQENRDGCSCCCDITETQLKKALTSMQLINQAINQSYGVYCIHDKMKIWDSFRTCHCMTPAETYDFLID